MNNTKPRVSVGLPVFNGGQFLPAALDSILTQTYSNFELIISDNASTDNTEEICRAYADRDGRINYLRNKFNIGAAKNYNRVFELSSGDYFKWAAHDDLCAPEYLERCVEVLDQRYSVVVCHTKTTYINESGQEYATFDDQLDLRSARPYFRYRDYFIRSYKRCNAVFGLIRTSELKKTPLIGAYYSSDHVLLAELALRGEIYRVPEPLFFRRDHPQQFWRVRKNLKDIEAWYEPSRLAKTTFPHWRLLWEHFKTISRVSLPWSDKVRCYLYLSKWMQENDGNLIRNLLLIN
jgi:glycosyltransferase involved in cell wall biosynthesis